MSRVGCFKRIEVRLVEPYAIVNNLKLYEWIGLPCLIT